MSKFREQDIEMVSNIIRPLIDPKDCGSVPHDEVVKKTAILFLETQSRLTNVATGQQDRFGNQML